MRYIVTAALGLTLGLLAHSAQSITTGEDCTKYPCVELPNRKMDCSAMNACMERNKAKNPPSKDKGPGKTRGM